MLVFVLLMKVSVGILWHIDSSLLLERSLNRNIEDKQFYCYLYLIYLKRDIPFIKLNEVCYLQHIH